MQIKAILFCFCIAIWSSCNKPNPQTFDSEGFSFLSPSGWEITQNQTLTGGGGFVSCEQKGLSSSGIFTVNYTTDDISPENYLLSIINNLSDNGTYKTGMIQFSDIEETQFNGGDAFKTKFKASILNTPNEGDLIAYSCADKQFCLLFQTASEDKTDNAADFRLIKKSWKCE